MTRCDRFEREGLRRLEQGLPLDEHFDTCADCRRARAAYQRLAQELAAAGARYDPPAGWQARVRDAIERHRERSWRGWRPWVLAAAGTAAVALIVALLVVEPGPPPSLALQVEIAAGGAARRGADAHPGDRLLLRASLSGARHAELRVYRNDADLVLRCATEPPCIRTGDVLEAALALPSPGSYQPLLLASDRPLPAPSAGLDADAGAALEAGATVDLGREVQVR